MKNTVYFNLKVDCESTQASVNDPGLGERAVRGIAEILAGTGMKATFMVIPSDIKIHSRIYLELEKEGHETGLHLHPADQGYQEFLGVYGFDTQVKILNEAIDEFSQAMGKKPGSFIPGYHSANDHTFPALVEAGIRQGAVSLPTRNLPQCACIWGDSPMDIYYPHKYNRSLRGNLDFVEIPPTVDPQSRMWGGGHPQDLRIELVDAKNHWYTIEKSITRQLAGPREMVRYVMASTHNTFDYSDPKNFRRETLLGIIAAVKSIAENKGCVLEAQTIESLAAEYRRKNPLPEKPKELFLDTRGRS